MADRTHWENIYQKKASDEVSWYQRHPLKSLEFIKATGAGCDGMIIDVGGGASTLVDHLLDEGFSRITVLDISSEALRKSKSRLGSRADFVTWMVADVTQAALPPHAYDIWHDRAVFHFLTSAEDRRKYLRVIREALKLGAHAILATFALDGPPKCSGLEVARYSPETLSEELGPDFRLIESTTDEHQTPSSAIQRFIYCGFQRVSV